MRAWLALLLLLALPTAAALPTGGVDLEAFEKIVERCVKIKPGPPPEIVIGSSCEAFAGCITIGTDPPNVGIGSRCQGADASPP